MLWACKHMPVDNVTRLTINAEEGRMNLGYIGRISNFRCHADKDHPSRLYVLFINYVSWKYLFITLVFPSNKKHESVSSKNQD